MRENLSLGVCEQHRRSPVCADLISALVIHFSEGIICKLGTGEISIFYLVSVAEETGLKIALSETPKTCFLAMRPI